MDFSPRNIIIGIIILVLAVTIPVTVKLAQQRTQLKSKAAGIDWVCNDNYCMKFDTGTNSQIAANTDVYAFVKSHESLNNVALQGTAGISNTRGTSPGGSITNGNPNQCGDPNFWYCYKFKISASELNPSTSQAYAFNFVSDSYPGAVLINGGFNIIVNVGVGGTKMKVAGYLKHKDGSVITSANVVIRSDGASTSVTTDNSGNFHLDNTVNDGSEYAVEAPDIDGYTRDNVQGGTVNQYERQRHAEGWQNCDRACNFTYTPNAAPPPSTTNVATCNFVTVDGYDITGGGNTFPGALTDTTYTAAIGMTNNTSASGINPSTWNSSYSLKFTGDTDYINVTGSPKSIGSQLPPGQAKVFSFKFTTPHQENHGNTPGSGYRFSWQMFDDTGKAFGEACTPSLQVFNVLPGQGGGTGTCPGTVSPGDNTIGGPVVGSSSTKWRCLSVGGTDCTPAGSFNPPFNYTCSNDLTCAACPVDSSIKKYNFYFGPSSPQCGQCRNDPQTKTDDPNCLNTNAQRSDDSSVCPNNSIGSKLYKQKCVDAQCIPVTKSRDCGVCDTTNCSVTNSTPDNDLCTDPTKPVCQPTGDLRNFCVSSSGGSGGTGGGGTCPATINRTYVLWRVGSGKWSSQSTPPAGNFAVGQTITIAAFHNDAIDANGNLVGDYPTDVQVIVKDPFGNNSTPIITPLDSTKQRSVSYTFPSLNTDGTAGGPGSYVFKVITLDASGNSLTGNKCDNTQNPLVLNVISGTTASPSPSPSGGGGGGLICTGVVIQGPGITQNGAIFTAPNTGIGAQVAITYTPASAIITSHTFTVTSLTAGAPDLTITEGNPPIIATIPTNSSTTQDNTYSIGTKISDGTSQPSCPAIQIVVPKTTVDTACPADIASTEVKFKNADNTGDWIATGRTITIGQSVKVAGFHNSQTSDTPPADITLSYVGPHGITGTITNGGIFTPSSDPNVGAGTYTFTATTAGKTGVKCVSTPTALTVTPAAQNTLCFVLGVDDAGKTDVGNVTTNDAKAFCDQKNIGTTVGNGNAKIYAYTDITTAIPDQQLFKDAAPGTTRTIFVKFIGLNGNTTVVSPAPGERPILKSITFRPTSGLSNVDCTSTSLAPGTQAKISGNFIGAQGNASVKIANQDAVIDNWDTDNNVITAHIDQRLDGKNDVSVTFNDGTSATLSKLCTINTVTANFKVALQCRDAGALASPLDAKVYEGIVATTEGVNPDPILHQTISIDNAGVPQGFAPKFEKNTKNPKKYELIIKAPGTLARRKDFDTTKGSANINDGNPIVLPQGDIAPRNTPDGVINAFDKSEMIRQWSIVTDVARTGDLNGDGRVNSVDYACMRQNINDADQGFSALPAPSSSPAPSGGTGGATAASSSPSPAASGGAGGPGVSPSPIPSASPVTSASPSPSPSPAAAIIVPPGAIPLRVSFDNNFATLAGSTFVDSVTGQTISGFVDSTDQVIIPLTLPALPVGTTQQKIPVYYQFYENGAWGKDLNPPQIQVANITLTN